MAAPGVENAVITGIRLHQLRPMQVRPAPMEMAHTHDELCAGLSPAASAAARTSASGPAYETTVATIPAVTAVSGDEALDRTIESAPDQRECRQHRHRDTSPFPP